MEYTDTVPVLAGHLEDLLRVLEAAEGVATSLDLQRSYMSMRATTPYPLPASLRGQIERIQGYLGGPEEDGLREK